MEDARIKAQKDAQGWASVMAGNVYRHFKAGCMWCRAWLCIARRRSCW